MLTRAVEYDKDQLDAAVAAIGEQFPNDIEYIRYTADEDWAHEPALFFRVLLKEQPGMVLDVLSAPRSQAAFALCNRIMTAIRTAVLDTRFPYVSFRWASEQAKRHDPEWD
jgi:hypothetical protein